MDTSDVKDEKETIKDTLGDMTGHASEYASTFYKLQVLKLTKKLTNGVANLLGAVITVFLGFIVLIFGGIALAFWVGDMIDSRAGGFAIIAGFFVLLAIIFIMVRKSIVFPKIRDRIVKRFYE